MITDISVEGTLIFMSAVPRCGEFQKLAFPYQIPLKNLVQYYLTRNAVGAVQTRNEGESVARKDGGLLIRFVLGPSHFGQQFVVSNPCTASDAKLDAQGRPDVSSNL